jgi:hypothetical protein
MQGFFTAAVAVLSFWLFADNNWLSAFPHGWFDNTFWRLNLP